MSVQYESKPVILSRINRAHAQKRKNQASSNRSLDSPRLPIDTTPSSPLIDTTSALNYPRAYSTSTEGLSILAQGLSFTEYAQLSLSILPAPK